MRDYGLSILEQYEIDKKEVKRVRGGILVEARQGYFLLKEANIRADRVEFLVRLYSQILENGFCNVDEFIAIKKGNI